MKSFDCLDAGCGNNKTTGCLGIDRVELDGVDVVHDLDTFPWPFDDDRFGSIYANHYLEHVKDIVETLRELHRITKNNGLLYVRVPHYASDNFNSDLTHKVRFGYRSFDHFSMNGNIDYDFYESFKFEIISREIKFMSPYVKINPFKLLGIEYIVNKFPRIYERFFVYYLPPVEVVFQLKVLKS